MDITSIKQKIKDGVISDDELLKMLGSGSYSSHSKKSGSFLKNILKGFIDGYTTPNILRIVLESILIFIVITALTILSYMGKMETNVTAVLLSSILGFLFGKIK